MTFNKLFSHSHRIVIKVGSSLLVNESDKSNLEENQISSSRIRRLVRLVVRLREEGREVVVVSSGAVAASRSIMATSIRNARNKLNSLPERQARSAVGQVYLMEKYRRAFASHGVKVGQILFSKFSINHRPSYLNVRNTIHQLWEMGVIPIINENDPLATDEFRFGENDILGALTCGLVDADLYLILSHVNGVYKNFSQGKKEKNLYDVITDLSPDFLSHFKEGSSLHGSGGILAKLEAARMASEFGVPTLIKNGNQKNLYKHILDNQSGTLICLASRGKAVNAKKRWLLSHGSPRGIIRIDVGASLAITKGKSLLPGGVIDLEKIWDEGDVCDVIDPQGKIVARGLCNYSHKDLLLIKGQKTTALLDILGRPSHAEVIHRDNMAIREHKN